MQGSLLDSNDTSLSHAPHPAAVDSIAGRQVGMPQAVCGWDSTTYQLRREGQRTRDKESVRALASVYQDYLGKLLECGARIYWCSPLLRPRSKSKSQTQRHTSWTNYRIFTFVLRKDDLLSEWFILSTFQSLPRLLCNMKTYSNALYNNISGKL